MPTGSARKLELSTSELQPAALELYRRAGYRLLSEAVAEQASNKTLGGGIRRTEKIHCRTKWARRCVIRRLRLGGAAGPYG